MDEAGIDVQILSHYPGIERLEAKEQVPMVRDTNDFLLETVAKYPARFAGFASVCTAAPDQAAKELERMMQAGSGAIINGHSRGRYLDDKFFWPILEAAEHLKAPIYLHPDSAAQGGHRRLLQRLLAACSELLAGRHGAGTSRPESM